MADLFIQTIVARAIAESTCKCIKAQMCLEHAFHHGTRILDGLTDDEQLAIKGHPLPHLIIDQMRGIPTTVPEWCKCIKPVECPSHVYLQVAIEEEKNIPLDDPDAMYVAWMQYCLPFSNRDVLSQDDQEQEKRENAGLAELDLSA